MTRRFAIYFAPPPGSELETFGRRWLGRDHVTGLPIKPFIIDGLDDDDRERFTRSARHYGFHATLKAPFALNDGKSTDDLHVAAETFAKARRCFSAPPLQISAMSRWVAFTLSAASADMDTLAADCVSEFEAFRAPLTEDDIARRRQADLSARQDEQLLAFGYPYIFEDFHFHMTLAGPLDRNEQHRVMAILRRQAAPLEIDPLPVDAISIYEQTDRDSAFVQTGRFSFRGT